MAYRSPVVGYFDPMRDVSGATLTVSPAAAAGQPASRLSDELARLLFAYGSAATLSTLTLDRGSDTTPLDWFFAPPGHNWTAGGGSIWWQASADDISYGTVLALVTASEIPGTEPASLIASTPSTLRYQKITFQNAYAWEFGEARFSERVDLSPTIGPAPSFRESRTPTERATELLGGGLAATELGDPLRRTSLSFSMQEGTDLAAHRALLEAIHWGQGRTVVFEGPDDVYPAYLAQMAARVVPQQDHPHPASGLSAPAYSVQYAFREVGA